MIPMGIILLIENPSWVLLPLQIKINFELPTREQEINSWLGSFYRSHDYLYRQRNLVFFVVAFPNSREGQFLSRGIFSVSISPAPAEIREILNRAAVPAVDSMDSLPQDHRGRIASSCASFYLFFSGTFLFTMAGTLLSTGAWCFLVRLPMIHLAREPSRIVVALSGYIFAAGVLMLPVSCILYREHNVTSARRTLLPVRPIRANRES